MDIYNYIKACFKARHTTGSKVAESLGISRQSLSLTLTQKSFTVKWLQKVANALNADFEIRFIDRETKKPLIDSEEQSFSPELKATFERTNQLLTELIKTL